MSSEILRRAADRLDELVAGTDRVAAISTENGKWYPEAALLKLGVPWVEDAAYIAALGPNVATALAAWLRVSANAVFIPGAPGSEAALEIARQILGPDAA